MFLLIIDILCHKSLIMYSYNQTIESPNNQDSRRNFYENSFKDLEQKILEYLDRNQENNIIVAISRKGPRNLKFIFNNFVNHFICCRGRRL